MSNERGSKFPQYLAATAGNLCILAGGAMLGWTSPMLLRLQKEQVTDDNPLGVAITEEEASWIGSLTPVGTLVGSFFAAYLAESWGRKTTLLFSVIPFTIGWILIAIGSSVSMLYVARFIFGLALSISFTIVPMYCGEISETSIRGILGSFLQIFITIGFLWAYCIGPFVSYTVFWITCAALPILFFVAFVLMPESPYFLSAQGKDDEVLNVLSRLRQKSIDGVREEAAEIKANVDEAFKSEVKLTDLFYVKSNFKALLLTCALVIFQQMTGINIVLFYSQKIFDAAGASSIQPEIATIVVGCVQLIASCSVPFVVDRLGRKILLIFSGIGETVSLIFLGLYFYLKDNGDASNFGWLPVTSLIVFIATYSVGSGPLPWCVSGEMFAADVKSKASGIVVFICWTLAFVLTKYFSNVTDLFGMHIAFWMFAVFCALSIFFTVFCLPETKGKTLAQIQEELGGKSNRVHKNTHSITERY